MVSCAMVGANSSSILTGSTSSVVSPRWFVAMDYSRSVSVAYQDSSNCWLQ